MGINGSSGQARGGKSAGNICIVMGIVAIASVVFIGVTSFTAFNPPNWARIVGGLLIPVSLIASVISGASGWRGPERVKATAGLLFSAVAVIVFVIMLSFGE